MNKKFTPFIVLAIIALFTLFQALFQINETEVAIVTRFGEFRSSYVNPGLKLKVPYIDSVNKFDKRLQRVDVPPESLLTSDKKRIRVDAYARYKILNPLLFFKTLTDETTADSRIASIVASNLREEIALDTQDEIISEKREIIMGYITNNSNLFEISETEASTYEGGLSNSQLLIYIKPENGARFTLISEEEKGLMTFPVERFISSVPPGKPSRLSQGKNSISKERLTWNLHFLYDNALECKERFDAANESYSINRVNIPEEFKALVGEDDQKKDVRSKSEVLQTEKRDYKRNKANAVLECSYQNTEKLDLFKDQRSNFDGKVADYIINKLGYDQN